MGRSMSSSDDMSRYVLVHDVEIRPGVIVPAGTAVILRETAASRLLKIMLAAGRETQMIRPPETAAMQRARACALN